MTYSCNLSSLDLAILLSEFTGTSYDEAFELLSLEESIRLQYCEFIDSKLDYIHKTKFIIREMSKTLNVSTILARQLVFYCGLKRCYDMLDIEYTGNYVRIEDVTKLNKHKPAYVDLVGVESFNKYKQKVELFGESSLLSICQEK